MSLFGFTPKGFEQLVQATAIHVFGPGVTIFGSGPDGGREGTFECEVPYPSDSDHWKGYGVIQAKCKEKTEGTQKDQEWAISLLEQELNDYVQSELGHEFNNVDFNSASPQRKKAKKRTRLPEYYVYVTNVVLTPASQGGGKDKAEGLIKSFYDKLPLRGHAIWDADQLGAFMDSYGELRQRFTQFVTPSDLLAVLIEELQLQQEDFHGLCHNFLDQELRRDENSRLDQGGVRTEERTPLAEVFIDLLATDDPSDSEQHESGMLVELLRTAAMALDSRSLTERNENSSGEDALFSRFVVVGGPGSGKSTLGQFLAQIYRAAWLESGDVRNLELETKQVVKQIKSHCEKFNFPWPRSHRIPFRIELSRFAHALATDGTDKVSSLADFLLRQFCPEQPPPVREFTRWLFRLPVFLILDGLDEVPVSSNRSDVCEAIRSFLADATRQNANVLVQATTRPEGYDREFGEESFKYRFLQPLSSERALEYSELVAKAKFGNDSQRINEMLDVLRRATSHQLTARLMQTPLQVTFLATVVAAGGRPPQDRWRLFRDYYDTIYKREQQKCEDAFRDVLDGHSDLIDRLHHDVGYALHVQGEEAGRTDAEMDMGEFESRVDARLDEDGWTGDDRAELRGRIVESATTRLVFLTSRVAGRVSFDVRSLQEFMACERLTSGPESLFQARLDLVAKSAYWRNVFLFVAGKCFSTAQAEHLRPLIYEVCEKLNDGHENPITATVRLGSQIAIDLLEDGAVSRTPRFARKFISLALELLDLPPEEYGDDSLSSGGLQRRARLARLYEESNADIYREQILGHLKRTELRDQLAAWQLLLDLMRLCERWAEDIAVESWPAEPADRFTVLAWSAHGNLGNGWVSQRLVETIPAVPPNLIAQSQRVFELGERTHYEALPDWVAGALEMHSLWRSARANVMSKSGGEIGLAFGFRSCFEEVDRWDSMKSLEAMPNLHTEWAPLIFGARFASEPTAVVLVKQLKALKHHFSKADVTSWLPRIDLPWPMASCLNAVRDGASFDAMIEAVDAGEVGDQADWRAAESRWRLEGLVVEDTCTGDFRSIGFDGSIGSRGFAWNSSSRVTITSGRSISACARALEKLYSTAENPHARKAIAALYALNFRDADACAADLSPPSVEMFREMYISDIALRRINLGVLISLEWSDGIDAAWLDVLDDLGKGTARLVCYSDERYPEAIIEKLTECYIRQPTRSGLLVLLSVLACNGHTVVIPEQLLQPHQFENARLRAAALCLLTVTLTDETASDELAAQIVKLESTVPDADAGGLTLAALESRTVLTSAQCRLLLQLSKQLSPDLVFSRVNRLLNRHVRHGSSGLNDGARAAQLGLPTNTPT